MSRLLAGSITAAHHAPGLAAEPSLARSGDAELALARGHRDQLLAAAAELVLACGHDPDVATCTEAACALGPRPDGPQMCRVAHDLARCVEVSPTARQLEIDAAVAGLRNALAEAADAVRSCRQTAHRSGTCWFAAAPGLDGCGPVLRLLHRLG